MKRVGKRMGAFAATVICLVLMCGSMLPLALAADTTPPVTNVSLDGTIGNNGWYKTNVLVSLTAVDSDSGVAHTYYRLDSGPQVTYGSSFTVTDGEHTLLFYSVDNANNKEQIIDGQNNISVKVDTQKPLMNISVKGSRNGEYYNGTTTLNLTAMDNVSGIASISYSFDNVEWKNYTGNISLPDGVYTIYYGSYDKAGNVYNNSTSVKVFDPTIGFNPERNKWYTGDVTIWFTLPSSHSVDHVDYSYDRKTWYHSNDPLYHPIYLTSEGNITIYYRSVGASGIMTDVKQMWYGIDKDTPTVGISYDGDQSRSKGWFNGDITVHINANDNGSINRTEYSWDNSNWNTYTDPFKVAWGKSRTIYFRTFDMFDRTASGSTFIYFRPGNVDQGPMSDSVYINGTISGGNPTATASPTENPTPVPTQQPTPTPTIEPSATPVPDTSSGSGNPLAIAVLVGVLAFLGIAAAAVYLFMSKKK